MEMKKERQLQGDRKPFLPPSYGSKTFEPDTNTYRRPVTAPEMSRPKTAKSETPPFRPTSPPKRVNVQLFYFLLFFWGDLFVMFMQT